MIQNFARYEHYKDAGIDWLGEIPAHWGVKRLKYLADLREEYIEDTEFKIAVEDIESGTGKILPKNETKNYQGKLSKFREKDILFNKLRPYLHKVYFSEKDGGAFGELLIIISGKELYPKFLFYKIFEYSFIQLVNGATQGTKMPRANWESFISHQKIGFPPKIAEQAAMAAYLDSKTAQIDALIAKKQRLVELLKEERTAVINQAVTQGLDPNAPRKPSGIDWLGDIPAHWEVKRLKYVAEDVQTGGTPPSNRDEYFADEIKWFTPSDFSENLVLSESKRKISRSAIRDDVAKLFPSFSVLLVSIGATLGKVGYIVQPASSNQQINAIIFRRAELAVFYAYFFHTNKENIFSFSNAATLAILNQRQTKEIPIPVPNADREIDKIVQFINFKEQFYTKTIAKIERQIVLLQEYRTALISEVVTGKVRVA